VRVRVSIGMFTSRISTTAHFRVDFTMEKPRFSRVWKLDEKVPVQNRKQRDKDE